MADLTVRGYMKLSASATTWDIDGGPNRFRQGYGSLAKLGGGGRCAVQAIRSSFLVLNSSRRPISKVTDQSVERQHRARPIALTAKHHT
jgi:hypothetical protein